MRKIGSTKGITFFALILIAVYFAYYFASNFQYVQKLLVHKALDGADKNRVVLDENVHEVSMENLKTDDIQNDRDELAVSTHETEGDNRKVGIDLESVMSYANSLVAINEALALSRNDNVLSKEYIDKISTNKLVQKNCSDLSISISTYDIEPKLLFPNGQHGLIKMFAKVFSIKKYQIDQEARKKLEYDLCACINVLTNKDFLAKQILPDNSNEHTGQM